MFFTNKGKINFSRAEAEQLAAGKRILIFRRRFVRYFCVLDWKLNELQQGAVSARTGEAFLSLGENLPVGRRGVVGVENRSPIIPICAVSLLHLTL